MSSTPTWFRRAPTPRGSQGAPPERSLRVSVTDRCDFRCRYCVPGDAARLAPRQSMPSLEDLARLVAWLAQHASVRRVRLTGGEPLLRSGLETLVSLIAAVPGVVEISLTTNGSRLADKACALKAAGLARVNVSLDTLDPERFARWTRTGALARTLAGIDSAQAAGLQPIKLNAVLHRSSWKEDVPRLLDFAAQREIEVRFIELMRAGAGQEWCDAEYVPAGEVQEWLGRSAPLTPVGAPVRAPARRTGMLWNGCDIVVGWITPRSRPFCDACDRLRLDAHGRLRRCLADPEYFPLGAALDRRPAEVTAELQRYLGGKAVPRVMDIPHAMNTLGG